MICSALQIESVDEDISPETVRNARFDIEIVNGKKKILVNNMVSGLSSPKAEYIRSLSDHFLDTNKLKNVNFYSMDDDELKTKLLAVKERTWRMEHSHVYDVYFTSSKCIAHRYCKVFEMSFMCVDNNIH